MHPRNNWRPQTNHMTRRLERMVEGAELIHGQQHTGNANVIRILHKPYQEYHQSFKTRAPYAAPRLPPPNHNMGAKLGNPNQPRSGWQDPRNSSDYNIDINQTMKIHRGFGVANNRDSSYNKVRESYYKRKQREQKYDQLVAPFLKYPGDKVENGEGKAHYFNDKARGSYYPQKVQRPVNRMKSESMVHTGYNQNNPDFRKSIDIAHQKYAQLQKSRSKIRQNDFMPQIVESDFGMREEPHQRSRSSIMERRYHLERIRTVFA